MSRASLAFLAEGRIADLGPELHRRLLERSCEPDPDVQASVAATIADLASRGDEAILEAASRLDRVELSRIEVPRAEWATALRSLPEPLVEALQQARRAIETVHRQQLPEPSALEPVQGLRLMRRPEPVGRVGAYAPGGRAAYPSTVLMCVVPAKVAGVPEVVVCSPPGSDGQPPAVVLAACELAGADRVFSVGGAAAVAALAYGTESVPRADKIVGPGNAYVTEAKRQLAGRIASDCLAGPSELLVVADASAAPELVALELMAQAEHDPDAVAVAVATDAGTAGAIRTALDRLIKEQPRADIVRAALERGGAVLIADTLREALDFATRFAPEHLLLMVEQPESAVEDVRCAGAVFLAAGSSVVFGDYVSGTNHVLPTGGQARAASGLGVADFMRWTTIQEARNPAATTLASAASRLAEAEGLGGHAMAARAAAEAAPGSAADDAVRLRDAYAEIGTYDPGRSPCEIDLSDNTNLFGVPPSAARALAELDPEAARRYPSVYATRLKEAIADFCNVSVDNVSTGCGSDDLLDSAIRAFCDGGDRVVYAEPTFSMIESFARMNAATPVGVPLVGGFELEVERMLAAGGRVAYICRPNNPTGNLFRAGDVDRLVGNFTGVVLIDEAYADFCGESLIPAAVESGRAVVLRTMSKAFGLAGLRVGFAVGPPRLIVEIEKSRGPYKVGVAAQAAAIAALDNDREWVADTVARTARNRDWLRDRLEALGVNCWPSAANFLLVQAPGGDARNFADELRYNGIGVRPFHALPGAGESVRITVGPRTLMERLVDTIDTLMNDARFVV